MADRPTILSAPHPVAGTLFAAVDGSVRFVHGQVAEMRFAALLAPFKTIEDAETALSAAGATLAKEGGA